METYTVYIHTAPNNKKYVGITKQTAWSRWRSDGSGYKTQPLFWNAIKKYGWENFHHEIVAEGVTQEIAEIIEIGLIVKYKCDDREYGYNVEFGGYCNSYKLSEEQKAVLRERFEKVRVVKQPMTEEALIEKLKGIRPTWEYISGYEGYRGGKVVIKCKKCGLIRTIAPDTLLGKQGRIKCNCNSDIKYHSISPENRQALFDSVRKPVSQYTKQGELVADYGSIKEATNKTGINSSTIGSCCRGRRKSAGGFVWKYQ